MFASNLARLRANSNLSQQQVAEKLYMARATYANLEAGKKSPTLEQLNAIGELFEVPTFQLIEGVSSQHSSAEIQPARFSSANDDDIVPRETVTERVDTLREVLLYVLDKVGAKPNVGETVLYKLLYFIDFDYYEKTGKSVTGLRYMKNHHGPTPTQTFVAVVKGMEQKGDLEIVSTKYFNHIQKKYLPVIKPELKYVNGEELRHIDEVLARLSDKTATELSSLSHRDMPWLATADGSNISYQLAKYRTADTSVKEIEDEL
jgi:transcriptional regulator with XRE-family HTH domain